MVKLLLGVFLRRLNVCMLSLILTPPRAQEEWSPAPILVRDWDHPGLEKAQGGSCSVFL